METATRTAAAAIHLTIIGITGLFDHLGLTLDMFPYLRAWWLLCIELITVIKEVFLKFIHDVPIVLITFLLIVAGPGDTDFLRSIRLFQGHRQFAGANNFRSTYRLNTSRQPPGRALISWCICSKLMPWSQLSPSALGRFRCFFVYGLPANHFLYMANTFVHDDPAEPGFKQVLLPELVQTVEGGDE